MADIDQAIDLAIDQAGAGTEPPVAPLSLDETIELAITTAEEAPEPEPLIPLEAPEVASGSNIPSEPPVEPDPLSPEDRAFLDGLPPKHRAAAEKWRGDLKRGAQEKFEAAAGARKEAEELDRHFAPYNDQLRASGMTRTQLVGNMLQQLTALSRDPVGGIEMLAQNYRNSGNVGPEQAEAVVRRVAAALGVTAGTRAQQPGQADDAQSRRIAALEAKIHAHERAQADAQQQQTQLAVSSAERKIQEFVTAKDTSGQAAHPHFDKVRTTIGALMQAAAQSGEELSLEQAYQRAVWAREDLRDSLIQARQGEAARAAAATRKDSLARARGAATPRTASMQTPPPNSAPLSIDALLDRGFAALQS